MKKLLSIIVALMLCIGLNAQTSLTQAPDFTATDHLGNEINLYEILEGGQHVLINFYTTTKDTTSTIPPSLVEAYKRLGCNQHDVFFISILPNAIPQLANKYIERYGIEFPIIHNPEVFDEGAAFDITRILYQVYEFPTTILIAPDKSIVLQDIASIKESEDIVSALTPFGIKEYECGNDEDEEPEYPEQTTVPVAPVINVYAENSGLIVIEWEAVETAIFYYVYHNGKLVGDGQVLGTEVEILVHPETTYCFTVTAVNTVGESEHSNEACATTPAAEEPENPDGNIEVAENSFAIYPNPVNDRLYIATENEVEEVVVYDIFGRQQELSAVSYQPSAIDVSNLNSGIYFVKVVTNEGEVVKRFVKK